MIPRAPFGATGHESSRVIFGAAALGGMKQARADATLELMLAHGVNHIDTAASYGESELRLAPFLADHRRDVFLATKTGARTAAGAREDLERSLERMGVERIDLIQMHNLVDENERLQALAPGGALEALVAARSEGLVRFIGITGHGTWVAARHARSLEAFAFDSILLPYSYPMNRPGAYAQDFEALYATCMARRIAVQTIKAVARRRWRDEDSERRLAWYMPLTDVEAIRRAVHYTLARPGLFLNSSSDATILPAILEAAATAPVVDEVALASDLERHGMEPLFVRGVSDEVR